MVDIINISLLDVIPESLKNDPIVIAMIKSIDDEIKAVSKLSETPSLYSNIHALESLKLDHLAWQYSADTWRDNWPIDLKRSVIKNVIHEKRKKGSLAAVEDAISSLGSAGVITE
ncbi:phage tail protein I [Serratia quinivorans]|jgi:phage tail P2-like protein|uniref:phage tail protein I n=1 Tax=Serratia quinivorans TaxID=137545 RepID=UPI00217AD132|nr:phage tail protein I [Serratia quinivorans]CAI1645670.1 Bacteriophage P2-related tail formation protein [Serratia quinivorans]CAI1725974.1 Bacteriophage P2-related tail formation protein [Serratia quinivorans]